MNLHPISSFAPYTCWQGLAASLVLAIFPGFHATAETHLDVIDTTVQHQTIDNFGASDAWTFQKIAVWKEENRNKVADLLFTIDKGIGLSLWRFNIGGGINPNIRNPWRTVETFEVDQGKYDWSRQAGERWFASAARARGVPYLLGFVNSPPGRMTKNGLTNSGQDRESTTNLKEGMEQQFAAYLCDIVEHFRDAPEEERLVFNYLSPINEPAIAWEARNNQEGNRASNPDIKRVLVALHREMGARKLDVKITAPEANSVRDIFSPNAEATRRWGALYGDYLRDFWEDPEIHACLDGVLCYHDYSSYSGPSVEKDHRDLGAAAGRYPGLKLWMSEICFLQNRRDLTINWAIDMAKLIHADLALASASAWQFWLALSNGDYKDGLLYTDWRRPGDEENIIESKTFWVLGNYSRFIRPGYVRVELKGEQHGFDGLLGSAYRDPKSGGLVLVYVNSGNEPQEVTWRFNTGSEKGPEQFVPWVTSESENLKAHSSIEASKGITLPARSVVTLVSVD